MFQFAQTSAAYACDVVVSFTAAKLSPTPAAMRLFIPGVVGREYSQALPPVTKESPAPYDHAPAPVLVIRQRGEAWTRPFAVIYEPTVGAGAIKSVTALAPRGEFSSFKVVSQIAGRQRADLVLVLPTADSVFEDVTFGLSFRGS